MKKEIKTYEELLKCHLKPFEAEFNGEKIFGTIKIDELGMRFELTEESKVKVGLYAFTGLKRWLESNFNNFRLSNFLYNIKVDDWQPKFGEVVIAYNDEEDEIKQKHIFLFKKDNLYHCVRSSYQSVDYYHRNDVNFSYDVRVFNFIKQIEEPKNI